MLYKIFGTHINILISCGILCTSLTTLLLYRISRLFINPIASSLTPITFIFVCAFGNYVYLNNYNFILPYTYAATYGIFFDLAGIYFFIKWIYNKKLRDFMICLVFISLALLCKIEIGLSLLATVTIAIAFYPIKNKFIYILISIGFFIIAIICALSFLGGDLCKMINNNFLGVISNNKVFLNWISGINNLMGNLYLIFYSTLLYILLLICFLCFDYILGYKENNFFMKFFITFTIYLMAFIIIFLAKILIGPYIQYRALPIICIIIIIFSNWKVLRREEVEYYISLSCITFFSLLLLTRIILKVSPAHYGFYILVPGLIPYYLFFFKVIPSVYQRFTKNGFYFLSIAILSILLILSHFGLYLPICKNRTLKIGSKRGAIKYLPNCMTIRYKDLLDYLINNTGPNETLVVFPEGIDINFHAGLENPIFYNTFLPYELANTDRQKLIISQIEKANVDYIVILQRDTTEYGPSRFGIDYGKELYNWIKENYKIIKLFGPMPYTTPEFGIALMKRKTV